MAKNNHQFFLQFKITVHTCADKHIRTGRHRKRRQAERERHRKRDTERDTERERQRTRKTERWRERQKERDRDRQTLNIIELCKSTANE